MENKVDIEKMKKEVIEKLNKQFDAVDKNIDEQYDKYAEILSEISQILKKIN